jgi:hypothetical protein
VVCDAAGAVYIGGRYVDEVSIGDTTLTGGLGFIGRLTSSGETVWARSLEAPCTSVVRSADAVYAVGSFEGTISFVPGTDDNLVAEGPGDVFVARFSEIGEFVWARRLGANGTDQAVRAAASPNGGVYVCGSFEAEMAVGSVTLTTRGLRDLFAVELTPIGGFGWAMSGGSADDDYLAAIAAGAEGPVIAGHVQGDAAFSGGFALEGQGNEDALLLHP